ncbi:MAG TPA: TIGR02757 family protein [Candidatus Hydrogenedens sp.]|nr:TIGR02757 family protein [Candidatus Hydrogenedens sp.]
MLTKDEIKSVKRILEKIYKEYHSSKFAVNDPVQWLYSYQSVEDKEIVGLISALFAFGSAKVFNRKIQGILSLWQSPSRELPQWSYDEFLTAMKGFRYRFVSGETVANFFYGLRRIIEEYSSVGSCFSNHYEQNSEVLWSAFQSFTDELRKFADDPLPFLVPNPKSGGACKRLCLYLRWMVRKDKIDVGCWNFIEPKQLIVPLDTHIYQWAIMLGLIQPRSMNARTAMLITEAFQQICPDDPLRYDFSLCQTGMLGLKDKIIYDTFGIINVSKDKIHGK